MKLGNLVVGEQEASKSWYKTGPTDIPIINELDPNTVQPLSKFSHVVKNMGANNQVLLYVTPETADEANRIVREAADNERNRQGSLGFDSGLG